MNFIKLFLLLNSFFSLIYFSHQDCSKTDQYSMVVAVNTKRTLHQSPGAGVQFHGDMADYAQNLSEYYAGQQKDRPTPPEAYGEEFIVYDPAYDTATSIVYNALYNESLVSEYKWYWLEPPSREVRAKFARFTQLVWWCHSTVAFGCVDQTPNKRFLVVVFRPVGNLIGKYAANVRKQRSTLLGRSKSDLADAEIGVSIS